MLKHLNGAFVIILVFVMGLFFFAKNAKADCVSEAVSCVVNAVEAQYYAVSSLGPVLQFTATHPQCVAAITTQDYVSLGVMGVVGGLSASGVIGSSEDGCHNDLYGKYAGQLAGALATIIPNEKLQAIAKGELAGSAVSAALNAVPVPATTPGLQTLAPQLNCGCAVASTGAGAVEKIKQAINSAGKAAKVCAGTFSCLGDGAVKAISLVGESFVQTGKCIGGPNDCGEQPPIPESEYYKFYFEPFVPLYVAAQLDGLGVRPDNSPYGYQLKNISEDQKLENIRSECEEYYLNHRYSGGTLSTGSHAQDACRNMRDNLFFPAVRALKSTRMDNEIFPKKMLGLMRAESSKYFVSCEVPSNKKKEPASANDSGVNVESSAPGADTFGSAQEIVSDDCKKQVNKILGLSEDSNNNSGSLIGQAGSVAYDVKNTYKSNNFDIEGTSKKLLSSGSVFELKLKDVIKTSQAKMLVSQLFNQKNVLLNKAYEKFSVQKWDEYRAKCPAKNNNPESIEAIARSYCISETASFIGITINKTSDVNLSDDNGYLNFTALSTPPKVYKLAQESFAKQGENATQDLADGRVQLAFAFEKSTMDAILPRSIAFAKEKLAPIRQKQEKNYQDKVDQYTYEYSEAIKCKLTLSDTKDFTGCSYSKAALDSMFNEWKGGYEKFTDKKSKLDEVAGNGIPFSEKPSDAYPQLLLAIDAAKATSKKAYSNMKKQPNAIIKDKKLIEIKDNKVKDGIGQVNALDKLTKDRKAETLTDKTGLDAADASPSLKNQAKDADITKGLGGALRNPISADSKPQVRGMRAAPGMMAATNKADKYQESKSGGLTSNSLKPSSAPDSQDGKPAAVTSLEESPNALKNRVGSQGIKDETPSRLGNGFDIAAKSAAPSAVVMPRTLGLPATANASDAAQQNTQGGRLSPGVSIAANSPPSAALPPVRDMTKPADNVGSGNLNNTRGLAAMPVGNIGNSFAVNAATKAGISRAPIGASSPSAPPPIKGIADNASLSPSVAPMAPFDRQQYQRVARQNLEAKWVPQCRNEPCKSEISALVTKRINEVLRMLDTGTDLRNNSILMATEAKMDTTYNPQMKGRIDASAPKAVENTPVTAPISTTPVEAVKNINSIKKRNF